MAASFYFLLFLLPLITLFLFRKSKKIAKPGRVPPGPRGLPLIGNLHQFDPAKPHEFLMKLAKTHGPLMSLKLGSKQALVISSAEMVREALKFNDMAFSGRPALLCSQKLSYNGLDIGFCPYGEYWREMRKMTVLHLLSVKKVQSFRPVVREEISALINRISAFSSSSQLVDLTATGLALTSTITCRIGFGNELNQKKREKKNFKKILLETEAVLGGFFVSDFFPLLGWIDKLFGMAARLEKIFQDLDSFYEELIQEHMDPNRPESMKNNILDLMIQLKDEQAASVDFTHDNIKAMLTNIFIAATTTSAASIIWAITCLMKNPSTMKRLQAEIRDFVQKRGAIVEEELPELPYLSAVIKETLRLFTPTPLLLPRQTIAKCTLGGCEIEPETLVFINAWAIMRDPKIWENPNDFKPERFLNSSLDVKGQDFELIPFGAGRRGCPGYSLALSTLQLVLANLLLHFDWELPSGMKPDDIDTEGMPGITMLPKKALSLVAKKYALI